jgi:nicotinate-nucleotide adenylyltransferase
VNDCIVLFGGTFDPVHVGHTTVVQHAARSLRADEVVFIPARRSPHKSDSPLAPADHRVNMLKLALEGQATFSVSRCEVDRPEPSYTYDTVMEFRAGRPGTRLVWLVGADMLASLPRWYRIRELLDLCDICLMSRGGVDSPDFEQVIPSLGSEVARRLEKTAIITPLIPVSSTEVRLLLAAGQEVSAMLHPAVLRYIQTHRLYGVQA